MISSNLSQREEYLRKRRRKKLIRIGLVFLAFLLVIGAVYYIAHRKEFRISKVSLSGGVLVTEEEIADRAITFLHGSYFWLFPKNNSLLYPKKELENYLANSFKRIDTIRLKLDGFQNLVVEVTERKPYAIWCKGMPEEIIDPIDEECYFMDQNSTIFAEAPNFSGDAYFKYYGFITTQYPIGWEYIASTTKFMEVSDFVSNVKMLSLKPQYVYAKAENEFSMKLSGGGEIYFDTKESLYKTIENLDALLRTKELVNLNRQNLPVEYIDLRFGNKLFYKLKN